MANIVVVVKNTNNSWEFTTRTGLTHWDLTETYINASSEVWNLEPVGSNQVLVLFFKSGTQSSEGIQWQPMASESIHVFQE